MGHSSLGGRCIYFVSTSHQQPWRFTGSNDRWPANNLAWNGRSKVPIQLEFQGSSSIVPEKDKSVLFLSIDWFKGNPKEKSHISRENQWFPVDFPLSQPIDSGICSFFSLPSGANNLGLKKSDGYSQSQDGCHLDPLVDIQSIYIYVYIYIYIYRFIYICAYYYAWIYYSSTCLPQDLAIFHFAIAVPVGSGALD